jgi:acetamidase/formamidase
MKAIREKSPHESLQPKEHRLSADRSTVHWGYYDAGLKPVFSIKSGDSLRVETEPPAVPEILSTIGSRMSDELKEIVKTVPRGASSHVLNGPVAIEGAKPGDVLEVHFESIELRYTWGFNTILPLKGSLAEDFPYVRPVVVEIDAKDSRGDWGATSASGAKISVPLTPFFGNFGVAPPASLGKVPSALPGVWGGNLDNKKLVAGSTVFFPIFVAGALFSIGDGHGCQGDGEVNSFALETGLKAVVRLTLRKDMSLQVPRAKTPTHYISMGFDPILDNAAKNALREAIRFLVEEKGLSADDAYTFCSLACDLRITQIVNGVKGVHCMIPRALIDS